MLPLKDAATGGSSLHPWALTLLDDDTEIVVKASCNQNGMSVFFDLHSEDVVEEYEPSFVWYTDSYGDDVTDVDVRVAGGASHTAKGFPDDEREDVGNNAMGIFFYEPGLAQRAAGAQELQLRTGTPPTTCSGR